jgi:hypothetical protein
MYLIALSIGRKTAIFWLNLKPALINPTSHALPTAAFATAFAGPVGPFTN